MASTQSRRSQWWVKRSSNCYGKAVDWWALGILAYEMIQGDSPFRHNVPTILFNKILKEEPEFSDRFTPEAQDLIMMLLTKDPEKRLGCGPDAPLATSVPEMPIATPM
ncbi:hypothetical protein JG688_00018285 [Phytophthora aleatoria]|uniref:Protein kinase domain-containing protein n=1 Tax=Phytophthora aleatoria TaxID=2496075 RepID=A0A8J5LXZ2_9STRA|nr:hypothetical protein JG688_00018285 [Phytophthora aleatoria]